MDPAYQLIPLDQITPSPTNPRKTFDSAKLAELAESIKAKGVLQPILVRLVKPTSPMERGESLNVIEHVSRGSITKLATFGCSDAGELIDHAKARQKEYPQEAVNLRGHVWAVVQSAGVGTSREIGLICDAVLGEPDRFELVAGERRFRAAKLAGLREVPAIVRDLADIDVLEIQAVENDQREDVLPSERAAGYQRLVDAGRTVDQVAAKVGKSPSWVRNVLKLGTLPEDLLDVVDDGRLSRATAELIARVPGEKARQLVGKCVVQACRWPERLNNRGQAAAEPLSFRDTKELIQRHFQIELKGAPFPRKALVVLAGVGSCDDCPKRAGNAKRDDPDLKDTRDDVCLDPACYRGKCEAWRKQQEEAVRADGKRVLSETECDKIFDRYEGGRKLNYDAPYFDLAAQCPEDTAKRKRSYKQLVGAQLADQVVVAFDRQGERHNLVPKPAAIEVMRKDHGLYKGRSTADAAVESKYDQERRAAEKKAKRMKAAAREAILAVGAKAHRCYSDIKDRPTVMLPLLNHLVVGLIEHSWADAARLLAQAKDSEEKDHRKAVRQMALWIDDPATMFALLAEIVAARMAQGWGAPYSPGEMGRQEKDFWGAWSVDRAKLLKVVDEKEQAKRDAKKPKSKPRNKPAPAGA